VRLRHLCNPREATNAERLRKDAIHRIPRAEHPAIALLPRSAHAAPFISRYARHMRSGLRPFTDVVLTPSALQPHHLSPRWYGTRCVSTSQADRRQSVTARRLSSRLDRHMEAENRPAALPR